MTNFPLISRNEAEAAKVLRAQASYTFRNSFSAWSLFENDFEFHWRQSATSVQESREAYPNDKIIEQ